MREPGPDYTSRPYERPNQPWVCGLASDGRACPAGPTGRGKCPTLAECVPVRDGDRWTCNRSELRGGPCDVGPTPEDGCGCVNRCHPVRSLRTIRGRFVTACTLLAAGSLIILLSADWRDAAISPGPIARQHAQLLEAAGAEPNCSACHAAAERGPFGWTASLVAGHAGGVDQSQRCMECHKESIPSEVALAAHSVPVEALRTITNERLAAPRGRHAGGFTLPQPLPSRKGSSQTEPGPPSIACAACHREHEGAELDLTAIGNAACQSCHVERYQSFAGDHPDFGTWPYERRTQIAFDHATHASKYFAEAKRAFDCRSCHMDDASGAVQLTASYDAACASCHDEKIATSVAQGVPMLMMPTLDLEALAEAGHDVGKWPNAASGDFDGRLPPAMKLLLPADPAAADAMAALGEDFEFFDVDPNDAEQLAAAADMAGAIQELIAELSSPQGMDAARQRLQIALGRHVSKAELTVLFAGLPAEMIRGTTEQWLPHVLEDESPSTKHQGAQIFSSTNANNVSSAANRKLSYDQSGAWSHDDVTMAIRYHPVSHADPVLTGWLELLAATPRIADNPLAYAMFQELTQPTAAGLCITCHSVERNGNQVTINWRAFDGAAETRGFTKFSHGPHLTLPHLADCTSCHALDLAAEASSSYASWNPHEFVSDFVPMAKQQCAACHTAKAAGDACQSCHNYHVDTIER